MLIFFCSQERDADREKIQQLLEENAQLHIERKASMEELVQLQSELSHSFARTSPRKCFYYLLLCNILW